MNLIASPQMIHLIVHPVTPQPRHITHAVELLRNGGVMIYPTDTVYGIGCSIFDPKAIERVYAIRASSRVTVWSNTFSGVIVKTWARFQRNGAIPRRTQRSTQTC